MSACVLCKGEKVQIGSQNKKLYTMNFLDILSFCALFFLWVLLLNFVVSNLANF